MAPSILHSLRGSRLGRALSAAALAAWLTAALQPCLMAAELVREPAAPAHMAGHAMHAAATGEHCGSASLAGCDQYPDAQLDSRAKLQTPGADPGHAAVVAICEPFAADGPLDARPGFAHTDAGRSADGPPLTIRYCSFLK